jgi:iron(III) transport system permease protein
MSDVASQTSATHLPDRWTVGAMAIAAILLIPLIAIAWLALFPAENIWPHLMEHALPLYLGNTLILMAMVATGAAIIGTGTAWLVSMTEFPGQRWLQWALLAPLAMPAYIGAYALVDMLEYAGPVQTVLRDIFGWQTSRDYWFPEIRSIGGAAFVLTLVLYPYVYLLARAAFHEQSVCALEVGRALGCGPWGVFRRVGLPLARPAIVAGVAIVCMETMADFGTVDYFAVPTLTQGIFAVWFDMHNAGGAAQIAVVMLVFVMVLLALERIGRRGKRFHHMSRRYRPINRAPVRGAARWLIFAACALPVLLGFVLPGLIVAWHAFDHLEQWTDPAFWRALLHTGTLALAAAVTAVLVGLFMVYGARSSKAAAPRWVAQATALGYAAPGAVLAVGVLIPLAAFDNWLADRSRVLTRVHFPIIRGSILTAGLLIFVDSAKELPATLILRPFNFETLATTVYNAASREQLAEAGPAALAIVVVGLLPVLVLISTLSRTRPGDADGGVM